ncbi:MAG TPA: pyridoxal-dependent decarboxylase [Gemmatimonadales bacterium]|jgi:aromatic-L-amino-acid decarboxylase
MPPENPTPFDPSADEVRAMGRETAEWIARHYEALRELPVIPDTTPPATFALFDEPVPDGGGDWRALLERFKNDVVPNSLHLPSPRYFGLMNPTPLPIAVFADALAAALNQNLGAWHHSPSGTAVERQVIRWLCDLAGYPKASLGSLTSGGSLANTTALKIALANRIPASTRAGIWGLPRRPVLYASAEAHFSIEKSANIIGIGGDKGVRAVPVNRQGKLEVGALRSMIASDRAAKLEPFCVVGIAGVTSTGVIDPLDEIADVAKEAGLWYHVDGAYGAGGLMSEKLAPRLKGIERADSITMDPHKWWYMPYPCGATLTRDPEAGLRAFSASDVYIPDTGRSIEFRHHGLQGSRPFSALKLWMAMKLVGRRAYGAMAEEQIALTERFVKELTKNGDWVAVTPVETAIACVRYVGIAPDWGAVNERRLDSAQDRIVQRVLASRKHWISATTTVGTRAIRVMVISYLTRWSHLEELIGELRRAAPTEVSA